MVCAFQWPKAHKINYGNTLTSVHLRIFGKGLVYYVLVNYPFLQTQVTRIPLLYCISNYNHRASAVCTFRLAWYYAMGKLHLLGYCSFKLYFFGKMVRSCTVSQGVGECRFQGCRETSFKFLVRALWFTVLLESLGGATVLGVYDYALYTLNWCYNVYCQHVNGVFDQNNSELTKNYQC